jgi:hypothetical protein
MSAVAAAPRSPDGELAGRSGCDYPSPIVVDLGNTPTTINDNELDRTLDPSLLDLMGACRTPPAPAAYAAWPSTTPREIVRDAANSGALSQLGAAARLALPANYIGGPGYAGGKAQPCMEPSTARVAEAKAVAAQGVSAFQRALERAAEATTEVPGRGRSDSSTTVADIPTAAGIRAGLDGNEDVEVSIADTSMETTAPGPAPLVSTVTTYKGPMVVRYGGSFTTRGSSAGSSLQISAGPSPSVTYVRSFTMRGSSAGSSVTTSMTARAAAGQLGSPPFSASGPEVKKPIREIKRKKKVLCGVC